MPSITKFRTPSAIHFVKEERGGFTISPNGNGSAALKSFQPLAQEAASYAGRDYESKVHYSDGEIDEVFFEQIAH